MRESDTSDADRILHRAAELESEQERSESLTRDQLAEIGREAGYDSAALDRAITEIQIEEDASSVLDSVRTSGLVGTKYSTVRSIPVQVTPKELLAVVELLSPYFEERPRIEFKKGKFVWRDRRKLRFELQPGVETVELHIRSPHLFGQKSRWKTWVGSAADQLEAAILRIASHSGE